MQVLERLKNAFSRKLKDPSDEFISKSVDLRFLINDASNNAKAILPAWNTVKENANSKEPTYLVFLSEVNERVKLLFKQRNQINNDFKILSNLFKTMGPSPSFLATMLELSGKVDLFNKAFWDIIREITKSRGIKVGEDGIKQL